MFLEAVQVQDLPRIPPKNAPSEVTMNSCRDLIQTPPLCNPIELKSSASASANFNTPSMDFCKSEDTKKTASYPGDLVRSMVAET